MNTTVLETRLAVLNTEYETGRKLLEDCEARARTLREQMLRIDGAMRVVRELLAEAATPAAATA